jgi:hypothetical protein
MRQVKGNERRTWYHDEFNYLSHGYLVELWTVQGRGSNVVIDTPRRRAKALIVQPEARRCLHTRNLTQARYTPLQPQQVPETSLFRRSSSSEYAGITLVHIVGSSEALN